jgi:hypothetical protein
VTPVLGLAVLLDPVAQLLGVEPTSAADLVTRKPAHHGLIVDPVLVHSQNLGDLPRSHHRLHHQLRALLSSIAKSAL